MNHPRPRCAGCELTPKELAYGHFAGVGQSADDYVRESEGTFDPATGAFLCDGCYIEFGMPNTPTGWTATPENLWRLGIGTEIEIEVSYDPRLRG